MGSAISLISSQESKRFYCFRLVSGITSLVMQASSTEEISASMEEIAASVDKNSDNAKDTEERGIREINFVLYKALFAVMHRRIPEKREEPHV